MVLLLLARLVLEFLIAHDAAATLWRSTFGPMVLALLLAFWRQVTSSSVFGETTYEYVVLVGVLILAGRRISATIAIFPLLVFIIIRIIPMTRRTRQVNSSVDVIRLDHLLVILQLLPIK